jgi:chromatin remodeling complex protein RSC6
MSSASASASASSAAKKGRKAASTSTPAAVTPAPVAAPVVAAPVVTPAPAPTAVISHEPAAATTEEVNVVSEFNALVEKVNSLRGTLSTVFSDMKKLEKRIPRELKRAQKGRRRKAAATTEGGEEKPKKATIFKVPTPISDALCTFLGVSKGTLLSRSEVTSRVCAYAKQKGLMEKQNIKADAALRKLLALTEKDELKILNLQRYLKPHYIKPAAASTTA